ncbi:hypothetical protein [Rhodococcus sp. 077-4]|uniref:hypothetical protein n=1 Tax=Rhodococcus sp. 077-4 TaxID=2789271 RepID=UPI0039F4BA5E
MTTRPNHTRSFRRGVIVTGTLPLLWWGISLAAGASGIGYDAIGDVVVTWNITTAVGLIVLLPAAVFSIAGSLELPSPQSSHRGRWYATVGLALTTAYCLLIVINSVLAVYGGPVRRDPNSWSPELSTPEQWAVGGPYALFLIPAGAVLTRLWSTRTSPASKTQRAIT